MIESFPETKIVGLAGSLRPESFTRRAVALALEGASQSGAAIQLVDLNDYDLIFANGKIADAEAPADVLRLREVMRSAQGFVLGTPEYHGSFSGVLKNALDLMGFQEFSGKIVGLVGVSGGQLGAVNALTSLGQVGRALHAWIYPRMVSVPQAWKSFDQEGNLKDPDLKERLHTVGRQVVRFSRLHTSEKHAEFLQAWEDAQPNPGGGPEWVPEMG